MFKRLLQGISNLFKPTVHRERNFVIKRSNISDYLIITRHNMQATVNINNNILFFVIFDVEGNILTRYCVDIDHNVSIDQFVVSQTQNNILFNIPTSSIYSLIGKYSDFFRSIHFLLDHTYTELYPPSVKHLYFKNDYYVYITFVKKRIINDVYRYTLKTFNSDNNKPTIYKHYVLGNILLSLGSLQDYIQSLSYLGVKISEFGIDQQLTDDILSYQKYINSEKVIMFKTSKSTYCYIRKHKGSLHLSYLDNFSYTLSSLKESSIIHNVIEAIFKIKAPNAIYDKCQLVSVSWKNGKLKVTRSAFDQEFSKNHEKAVNSMIKNNFHKLQLTHPSTDIIESLSELGLATDLPLLKDTLTVLDMVNV